MSQKLSNRWAIRGVVCLDVLLQLIQRVELIVASFAPELVLLISRFFQSRASLVVFVPGSYGCLCLHVDTSNVSRQRYFLAECLTANGAVEVSSLLVNSSDMAF